MAGDQVLERQSSGTASGGDVPSISQRHGIPRGHLRGCPDVLSRPRRGASHLPSDLTRTRARSRQLGKPPPPATRATGIWSLPAADGGTARRVGACRRARQAGNGNWARGLAIPPGAETGRPSSGPPAAAASEQLRPCGAAARPGPAGLRARPSGRTPASRCQRPPPRCLLGLCRAPPPSGHPCSNGCHREAFSYSLQHLALWPNG